MFAKLFETTLGQILAKLDQGDEGKPEVRVYFEPGEGLGLCSMSFNFTDTDKGWDQAEKILLDMDELTAIKIVEGIVNDLRASGMID